MLYYSEKPAAMLIFHIMLICTIVFVVTPSVKLIKALNHYVKVSDIKANHDRPQTAKSPTQVVICACKQVARTFSSFGQDLYIFLF